MPVKFAVLLEGVLMLTVSDCASQLTSLVQEPAEMSVEVAVQNAEHLLPMVSMVGLVQKT